MAKNRPKVLKHSYPFFQIPPAPPKHTQNTKKGFLFLKTHNPKDYFYLMFDFCRKIWHNCNFIWFWIPYCFPLSVNHFQKFFPTTWLSLSFKMITDHHFNVLGKILQRLVLKHCQWHNGPKGWVLLTKVTSLGHIASSYKNLHQISSSESRPSINFKISTKHQHFD